ncbi:zeta toxin family protein [Xanthomonas campestris pv. campestris]|uniref:zeta toxin family protein n=1 Tax=Xanthomonas campestris TaxID=339 RepID=UPI0025A18678|nr:zeta toxin family protein [Xanthomonas campestris]MDM7716177.1 zeta toxin family protein [Xanthomonas campestris pv. campestris]MEA0950134.1 zeta toxin family protein [Xanthomonas campestris pv. campestris]
MNEKESRLDNVEHRRLFEQKILDDAALETKTSFEHPKAIILAGQPGSGKGSLARAADVELGRDVVLIDPDELRNAHPEVSALRNAHPYTWSGYTHSDASQWADELLQVTIEGKKNLIFDTTLSNGQWSAELIKDLQSRGYDVEVRAMAAHKLESEHGVDSRFSQQLDREGYGRYVPESHREVVYTRLPISLDTVHAQTTAPVRIFNRQGAEVYDSRTDARPPGQALEAARNAWFKDPAVTQVLRESWQQQVDWHRDLPAHVQDIPNAAPAVQEQVLAEHAELHVSDGVNSRLEGIATIDELVRPGAPPARVPVPEPEIPGLRRAGMTAGLAGLGVAATAYDASQTGERVGTLLAQDNLTAARSEALHFSARGIGGWAGGTAAAAVVGTTGAGPVALVVADGYLFSAAADKAVTLWDNRQIYTQTDKQGVSWEFNGNQWLRQEKADLPNDSVDAPQKQAMFALPEKARELNYHASSEATEQALGKVQPSNPYVQPSSEADAAHLYARDWRHDPASGQWSRMIADEVDRNERPVWTVDPASPERSAGLDQQAAQVVDANIARGPAAIAATYQTAYQRNGWDDFGPVPSAVQAALNPDSLQASDGKQYQRDTQDQWRHDGVAAEGNVPSELNATRERLQPALEQHGQALAQMPARQAPTPTPEQQDQANTEAAYAAYGVAPNAQTAGAIQLAVQRTREANGIDAATSSLALQRDTTAQYSVYSPIQHLSRDADGAVRVAAMTSTDDIHQALSEVQSLRQEQPPSAGAPERRSNALTHSRPKSAMLTSKRCGRLIGKVCLRKKRSKPQALRRQRLPPRMWMKPEHLRRPLMRSEIETLHVHPMRLLLRRRQRLLLSRWLHPSTRLCRKTCARSPSLPNRSPNLSRNENPKRPKHLRLGHPRQPAQSSRGQRQWAQPWRAHLRRTLDQHHPLRPSPIKRLLRQLPQHRAHRMKWKGCAWATGGKKSSSCNIACSK